MEQNSLHNFIDPPQDNVFGHISAIKKENILFPDENKTQHKAVHNPLISTNDKGLVCAVVRPLKSSHVLSC